MRQLYQKLYGRKWKKKRALFLKDNPLCKLCASRGIDKLADVVDHVHPHRGDDELFWDEQNWQPLCKHCHDSIKAEVESRGYSIAIGADGWPLSSAHPVNAVGGKKITKF